MSTALLQNGDLFWQPSLADIQDTNLWHYLEWLKQRGLAFSGYRPLWRWSVERPEDFWASIWEYCRIQHSQTYSEVLQNKGMPAAEWFGGARLNYAQNIFAKRSSQTMLYYKAEGKPLTEFSWDEIYVQVARLSAALRGLGVKAGDRVVGYLPNTPQAVVALLATASVGAIWSSCPPDFGNHSVVDRFAQIKPKVLIAFAEYSFGGKTMDRCVLIGDICKALPSLERVILIGKKPLPPGYLGWDELQSSSETEVQFEQLPFDHPLWILYSSGTTGLPKPIVQGHGGILLEHAKVALLHNNLKPQDRYFWYTSTGWMLWNLSIGTLLSGCGLVLYDGSPTYPDIQALWKLLEEAQVSYFGMASAYVGACIKAEVRPENFDLGPLKAVGVSASPLTLSGYRWIHQHLPGRPLECASGGTDVCTAFVGGIRTEAIYTGEIQGPYLGVDVAAYNEAGVPVVGALGELVVRQPMPSMPLFFWNDPDHQRYRSSYFDTFPGVWCHGDWIAFNQRGGCVIYGRSDSTINRQGVRMGTSEIYQVVESLPEILDSLVVDLEFLEKPSCMWLFVVLGQGQELTDALKTRLLQAIKQQVSPRHVPDEIYAIPEVPYTLTGKKMEVPIRKILLGFAVEKAATPGAMRNPGALSFFLALAQKGPHPHEEQQ